jgi:hypothetical protein
MTTASEQRPTPQDYADLFEVDKRGARILEDLIMRFYRPPSKSSGIDRILDAHEFIGRRKVIDFIATQINRVNGVPEDSDQGEQSC